MAKGAGCSLDAQAYHPLSPGVGRKVFNNLWRKSCVWHGGYIMHAIRMGGRGEEASGAGSGKG